MHKPRTPAQPSCGHKKRGSRARQISIRLLEQKIGTDLEPLGDPLDIVDRHVALGALDPTEIGAVHIDFQRKILLADAALLAASADIGRQYLSKRTWVRAFHPIISQLKMVIRRRVLSII